MTDTQMTPRNEIERVTESPASYTAHVIPHTHWDREWYRPFQVFRARLVRVVDRLLDILERDPRYPSFTLDGQAILLDDYLAVRPERRDDIARLVRDGRLHIGPWYVLADEFLVSPEALVRNLMLGIRTCRHFGAPMKVAYTPDSFGHISQLPLIVKGFGLDDLVFERGVGDEGEVLGSEFRWVAADGETEVFAVHLVGTYSAAAALGHADWEMPGRYDRNLAIAHVRALLDGTREDLSNLPDWFRASIERIPGGLKRYARNGAFILLNGSDHLFPQADLPAVLDDLNEAFDDVSFVHSDIGSFLADAKASPGEVPAYQGEFRGSRYQHILSGVLSTRMYLKQANHRAEVLLERYAEPLAALAWRERAEHPSALLRAAWRLLLENHPHDSICGCSVDAVHREMTTRFDGVVQLGEDIAEHGVRHLAGPEGRAAVAAFNPVPHARTVAVQHVVDVPRGQGRTLLARDAAGTALLTQVTVEEVYLAGRPDPRVDRTTLRFLADLPPLGVGGFVIDAGGDGQPATDLAVGEGFLENRYLRLAIGAEGSLVLFDKVNDTAFPLDLHLEDAADAGDAYDFSPVAGDTPQRIALTDEPPVLTAHGPVLATMRFEGEARVPEGLSDDRRSRIGVVAIPYALEATLEAASPLLRIRVELTNHARDHRLRLRLATAIRTQSVWADGHYDVLERPLRPPGNQDWFQTPTPTSHQRRFVAVQDRERGIAILNRGLPEYEAIPTDGGVDVAVTLLRAVGWLSREDLASRPQGAGPSLPTPEAQCLGFHSFDLALHPFAAAWWDGDLLRLANEYVAPPRTWGTREAPVDATLLNLSGSLQLSAVKRAEDRDSLIVRLYNPAPRTASGRLALGAPVAAAYRTRLDEARTEEVTVRDEAISLTLGSKQVATIEIVFAEEGDLP